MRIGVSHTENFLAQHRLVRDYFDCDAQDLRGVPAEEIEHLGYLSIKLARAINTTDREHTRNINSCFYYNDGLSALNTLDHKLHDPIRTKLGEVVKWLGGTDDHDFVTFLDWNAERTREFRSAIYRDKKVMESTVLGVTDKLMSIDFFPGYALKIVYDSINRTSLRGLDSFEAGGENANGIYNSHKGGGIISLANQYNNRTDFQGVSDNFLRTVTHETFHAAGDERGYFYGIDKRDSCYRAIDEAFVEHSTVVGFSQQAEPDIIIPSQRSDKHPVNRIYYQERRFLGVVAEGAKVPAHQLAEGYFSNPHDRYGHNVRADIAAKIGRFLGSPDRLRQIMVGYENTPSEKRSEHLRKITNRL